MPTLLNKLLTAISDRLPAREISCDITGAPYLNRYYLGDLFGYRFYLHLFLDSDPDRGVHNHPWSKAYSLILQGYYLEQLSADGKAMRRVRWFNRLTGDTFHRVILPFGKTATFSEEEKQMEPLRCWTLFAHSIGDVKRWGFITIDEHGRQTYKDYAYPTYQGKKPINWWLGAQTGKELRLAQTYEQADRISKEKISSH